MLKSSACLQKPLIKQPLTGASDPEFIVWLRHNDPKAGASLPALVALADAPPVAATTLITSFSPSSTMTWMLDVLTEPGAQTGEWFLVRSRADAVSNGYSTHSVNVCTTSGDPIFVGSRNVAVFF